MAAQSLDKGVLQECLDAVARHDTVAAAARSLNLAESTLRSRLLQARKQSMTANREHSAPVFPDFGASDMPIENIIDHMSERFKRQHAHHKAREWFDIEMPDNKPIALCLMGDPHVDDNGCNWRL